VASTYCCAAARIKALRVIELFLFQKQRPAETEKIKAGVREIVIFALNLESYSTRSRFADMFLGHASRLLIDTQSGKLRVTQTISVQSEDSHQRRLAFNCVEIVRGIVCRPKSRTSTRVAGLSSLEDDLEFRPWMHRKVISSAPITHSRLESGLVRATTKARSGPPGRL
jgi:hypothetical protein